VLATVVSMSLYKMVIQHSFVVYYEISHLLFAFAQYRHLLESELCDTPNLKALDNSYLFEINTDCTLT